MRSGGCTVQQALTLEAASMVKQALSLARRRGHDQVTPLHVASSMLSSSTCLLRAACLHSHSHPLQCKALELCFNVSLNRLPSSSSYHPPSLSNALIAAFKRAQAHQRRGSAETQQQPLLAVKIELDQLIISILDDPSVSRVMREAGFSSTQVKSNVEQLVISSSPESPSSPNPNPNPNPNPKQIVKLSDQNEDVGCLVDALMKRRKRSVMVVGECLSTSEGVVKGLMDRVEKGEVPEDLKGMQFISASMSFLDMSRNEMEVRVSELRSLVMKSSTCCVGRSGAVLYLGNVDWAADYWTGYNDGERDLCCSIGTVMREIGRMVSDGGGRFWVMGVATYQVYMKCRTGIPSLESLWSLQPLTNIPAGSLDLSLSLESNLESQWKCKRNGGSPWLLKNGDGNQLTCCADCSREFQNEAQGLQSVTGCSTASNMPSWLQPYKENNKGATRNDQASIQLKDLYQKWNSICSSSHIRQHPSYDKTLCFSAVPPSSSSISSYGQCYSGFQQIHQPWPVPIGAKQPRKDRCIWMLDSIGEAVESNSRACSQDYREQTSSDAAQHNCHSVSSAETMEIGHIHKFKELTAENLKTLCNALEEKVSWQSDIIPEIVRTILQCRSGMMRRKYKLITASSKEETWLFFQGGDVEGKEKIAMELANLIFGSHTNFTSISLSNFSPMRLYSTDNNLRHKRLRDEMSHSYIEKFIETIHENPHRVIMMEDIEQVDYCSQKSIKVAIEKGRIQRSNGEEISISDAIVIFSCESFDSRSRACSTLIKQKTESDEEREVELEKDVSSCICLDLNVCAEEEEVENLSYDDVGLLESVDRTCFLKLPHDHL